MRNCHCFKTFCGYCNGYKDGSEDMLESARQIEELKKKILEDPPEDDEYYEY